MSIGQWDDQDETVDPELMLEQILANPELTQQLTRTVGDGNESVVAYFRCRIEPAQQRVVLHLPLVPPMERRPEVEASIMDDVPGRVRITDRQRFGIRLEIVLSESIREEMNLLVEIVASAPVGSSGTATDD